MAVNEDVLRKTIAENIAFYRKRSGDTQQELAEKLQYSDKSVSKWERGESTPDVLTLARMAELYHISVGDYLRQEKVPKKARSRILILLLSIGIAWLVFSALFVASCLSGVLKHYAWILFIYAAAVSCILCVIFARLWAGKTLRAIAVSALVWSIGLSIVFSIGVDKALLLILCGVMQVLVLLWFLLPERMRPGKHEPKPKPEE
jgi:transcriptional regulator with XRE-family HTH domain